MSAVIFPFVSRHVETAHEIAARRVHERLRGKVSSTKLSQAKAQAIRSVLFRGLPIDDAIERAVKWALGTDDPEPSPLAA